MTFAEIIAATVPEKQEAVRQELAKLEGAVKIDSREAAEELVKANRFVEAVVHAGIGQGVTAYQKRFQEEQLPALLDEKIKAMAPKPKDPELAAALERVQKLERAAQDSERKAARAVQRAKVLGKLGELGLDEKLADRFIGETDEETDAVFFKGALPALQSWRDGYAEKILRDRFGNQSPPALGKTEPTDLRAQWQKAIADGNADLALALQGKLQAMGK